MLIEREMQGMWMVDKHRVSVGFGVKCTTSHFPALKRVIHQYGKSKINSNLTL